MIVDLKEWINKISVVSTGVGVTIWLTFMLPLTFVPQSIAPVLGGLLHASLPIAAAVLGWLYGTKAWHCGFWMLGVQLLIMVVLSGLGNMIPVIVGYYLLLVGICALAAVVAASVRRAVQTCFKKRQA